MYFTPTLPAPKKLTAMVVTFLLCALLAAAGPMASISNAQSAIDTSQFNTLKQKVVDELTRRIEQYKKTVQSLNVDVSVDKDGAKANASSSDSSASVTANKDGLSANVELPTDMKDKVQAFMQKVLDSLTGMLEKVSSMTPNSTVSPSPSSSPSGSGSALDQLKSLAGNLDSQFGLDQLTQVQAAVTQAIDSMKGVFDNLKSAANGLKGQLTGLKSCVNGLKDGSTTAEGTVSTSDGVKVNCGEFNTSSDDVASNAQSQLDNVTTVMTTISSMLLSSVTLLISLVSQFSSLTGGLGSLGSLGNLGNLSSMLSGGDISSLTGSLGSVTGMMSSFSAITSQMDIANGMSGNAQNLLGSLTSLINV